MKMILIAFKYILLYLFAFGIYSFVILPSKSVPGVDYPGFIPPKWISPYVSGQRSKFDNRF